VKEAKRQRTGEAEEEALRLHFKRQEEELKEQELKSGCGVPARRKCRSVLGPSCVVCRAVGCIDTPGGSGCTCGGVDLWVLPGIRAVFPGVLFIFK
jgi:hypothetical protein